MKATAGLLFQNITTSACALVQETDVWPMLGGYALNPDLTP